MKFGKVYFEKEYSKTKGSYWGMDVGPLIISFEKILKRKSKILDLGCGEGRVAVYLAKKGHIVDAMDISKTAIERLKDYAKKQKVKVNAEVADLESYRIKKNYDVIIALASIHFLTKKEIYSLVKEMQNKTKVGGYNFITVFRKGDPSKRHFKMYFFHNGELSHMYSGWEIISYKEFSKKDQHPGGPVHYHKNANLIAQKTK